MNFSNASYELAQPSGVPAQFTWLLRAPEPGLYRLQASWTSDESRASNARYRAMVNGQEQINTVVDQRESGGSWVDLGQLSLSGGGVCEVRLSNDADGTVAADAVRLTLVGS
jgi:hypothetical protein